MSLLHPTTGEIIDRLTLVELKIEHCQKNGLPCEHFLDEARELGALLFMEELPVLKLMEELKIIHKKIWDLLETDSSSVLRAANQQRYALREAIDKLTGEWKGNEKV